MSDDTLNSLPYVLQANYARLRDGLGRVEEAISAAERNRISLAEALEDGIGVDMEDYVRGDLERAEQEIATALASIVLDYTNVLLDAPQDRLAAGLTKTHPSLLANLLRAVLKACRNHEGDARLPAWSWQDNLPVPTV